MNRFVVLGLGALALSCGSDPVRVQPPGSRCPLVKGAFYAYAGLTDSSGTCSSMPKHPYSQLSFQNGELQSPVGDLITCATVQNDCAVFIECTPNFMRAKIQFAGTINAKGDALHGTLTASGSYQGCSRVTYLVALYAKE